MPAGGAYDKATKEAFMRKLILFLFLVASANSARGAGPGTQPVTAAVLQMAADTALQQGDYATALTIYEKVAERAQDDPDRLQVIKGKIRVCQRHLKGNVPPKPRAVAVPPVPDPEERKPHVRPPNGQVYELTIKQLGNFQYDVDHGGSVPEDVLKLNGAPVRLRGFMVPLTEADRVTEFALVPSLVACCFGQPPQIQHTIVVHLPKGQVVSYTQNEVMVEGPLHVEEKKDDGFVVSLFELDCTSVKSAPK
jgi:hypothetical protein